MGEAEGEATHLALSNKKMVIATNNNFLKIWDISRKSWRSVMMARAFEKNEKALGEIKLMSVNADGTKVYILADAMPIPAIRVPDTKFYIYDVEYDNILEFEISKHRIPVNCSWDKNDPRLLGVEAEYVEEAREDMILEEISPDTAIIPEEQKLDKEEIEDGKYYRMLFTFFISSENGVREHAKIPYESSDYAFLGIDVPYYFLCGFNRN